MTKMQKIFFIELLISAFRNQGINFNEKTMKKQRLWMQFFIYQL